MTFWKKKVDNCNSAKFKLILLVTEDVREMNQFRNFY